ncbi:MAG: glycosyl transferase, group 1, partial [uncultured bacterium]
MPTKVNHPHIVIDARLYGPRHTGLGRYTKNLLIALANLPEFDHYRFTLIIYPELKTEIKKDLGNKYEYYVTHIRHYTFAEQFFLPAILWSLQPSLVHFTHLDKPILYFGKSVVTVHDLIRHFSKGSDTTTRSPLLYWPKYWGYLLMSSFVIRFNHLIVPSDFWRNYIIEHYKVVPSRIVTTHEAVDPSFSASTIPTYHIPHTNPYILYTGNLYPHKNIDIVFKALQKLPSLKLKIICARDIFHERAFKLTSKLGLTKQVEFLGYVPDEEFISVYQKTLALVHPAFLEGFSLTGLEAMSLGTPVIAANSSCLPEIYENSVLYFDPKDPNALVRTIKRLQKSPTLRKKLISLGY